MRTRHLSRFLLAAATVAATFLGGLGCHKIEPQIEITACEREVLEYLDPTGLTGYLPSGHGTVTNPGPGTAYDVLVYAKFHYPGFVRRYHDYIGNIDPRWSRNFLITGAEYKGSEPPWIDTVFLIQNADTLDTLWGR